MTVPVQTPVSSSTANGVTTVFPYGFQIVAEEDLSVTVDGVLQTSGYTVSGVGNPAGGNVTFTTAPANGLKVVRFLNPILKRTTDYQQFGDWLAAVVNLDFDRIWLTLQTLAQNDIRSLKLPVDTSTDQALTQDATARANKTVKFDASGNLTISTYDPDTAQTDSAASAAAALVSQNAAAASASAASLSEVAAATSETNAGISETNAAASAAAAAANVPVAIHAATADTAFQDTDEFCFWDSVSAGLLKITGTNMKSTLKTYFDTVYASLSGATFTGLVNLKDGADIASAATIDLTAATGNTVNITGTTATSALTMNAGQQMVLIPTGAWPLTYHATTMNINGSASYTCAAGDRILAVKDKAGVIRVNVIKQDGTALAGGAGITLGTPVASTSGTSIDFTSIPAGTKRITLMFDVVSTSGTSAPLIQLGDSGGVEVTGYEAVAAYLASTASAGAATSTSGFNLYSILAANTIRGSYIFSLLDASTNTWVGQSVLYINNFAVMSAGVKSLSATLDRIRITTTNGTDTFDAGTINISWG